MRRHDRWPHLILALALTVVAAGCSRAGAIPYGSTNPPQAHQDLRATPLALPELADRLAFTREGQLVVVGSGGYVEHVVSTVVDIAGRADWSPDGRYLALADEINGNTDIFILPLDDEGTPVGRYNVTRSPNHAESSPAWSPDQQFLAYSDVRTSYWAIYVMEIGLFEDNREPLVFSDRRVSQHAESLRFKGHPAWSPDGKLLAYTSNVGTRWQLTSVVPYKTVTTPLTGTEILARGPHFPANTTGLSWSPDGTSAVFAANPHGNWDLYVIGTEDVPPWQLTTHVADDWNPAWSPNGEWIAFTSNRSGAGDIYLISPDSTQLAQVTTTAVSEDFATWIPQRASAPTP